MTPLGILSTEAGPMSRCAAKVWTPLPGLQVGPTTKMYFSFQNRLVLENMNFSR